MHNFQFKSITLAIIFTVLFVGTSGISDAATISWNGGGTDNLSSNNLNWAGELVPQNGDDIVFDITSSKDCTWNLSISLNSINITPEYPGTVTFDADVAITGDFIIQGGTVVLNSNITISDASPPFAPNVITIAAANINGNAATLNATVNPNNSETTAHFEWGPDTSYGNSTSPESIGNGTSDVSFSQNLAGLSVNTTYHFRVVATNPLGTSYGDDMSFSTTGGNDLDNDTVSDNIDNCPTVQNIDQADSDDDGAGDACSVYHCVSDSAGLQQTLTAAESNNMFDVIQLEQGTYTVSANGNNSFSYDTSQDNSIEVYGISILGGYAAGCGSRSMDTVNTIIDGEDYQMPSGSHGVIAISTSSNMSIASFVNIEGITVTKGFAGAAGGGIYIKTVSGPINLKSNTVNNNTVLMNCPSSDFCGIGGGVYAESKDGDIHFYNNEISQNTTEDYDIYGVHLGGGVYVISEADIELKANTINSNDGDGLGGGIRIQGGNNILVHDNEIKWNRDKSSGGLSIDTYSGNDIILSNNNIAFNISTSAILINGYVTFSAGVYINADNADVIVYNNVIRNNMVDNTYSYDGAGLSIKYAEHVILANNTITDNDSAKGGGLYLERISVANVFNNIIWSNGSTVDPDDVYLDSTGTSNFFNNNFDPSSIVGPSSITNQGENLNVDPQFVDPSTGDYNLSSTSPLRNQGSNSAPFLPDTDFEGDSRISEGTVDIGADEYVIVSDIAVSPLYLIFGNIGIGNTLSKDITVTNNGTSDLTIYSITSPSLHFNITFDNCSGQTIAASSTCTLTVEYTQSAEGIVTDLLNMNSSDTGNSDVIVFLQGEANTTIPVNPPEAVSDSYTVTEGESLNAATSVLANDSDIDGDSLTAVLVSGTDDGILNFNEDGFFTYTPNTNYNGSDTFSYYASDGTLQSSVVIVTIHHMPTANAGPDQTVFPNETVQLDGSSSDDIDGDSLTYLWSFVAVPIGSSATLSDPGLVNPTFIPDMAGIYTLKLIVNDSHINSLPDIVTITAGSAGGQLPPDPSDVAPPLDLTEANTIYDQINFLYTGSNPIQTGVTPDTIEPRRAAVLRGLVSDRDGNPLPGVTVKILDHSEFGQTLTRSEGMFDLAVNGGGSLKVTYELEGYLPVQRSINVPWQDFRWLPDVVLIELDPQVTSVDLSSALPIQVAQGTSVTDDDGTRQATLMFAQGTQAEMIFPDGSTQPLTTLNVRATEYTVGPNGPQAMPGELPPTSGYTYAIELSADEAMAAGAKQVNFSQPVPFYVENFLGFPVGGIVPAGYYDRDRAVWIASDNGLVVEILSVDGGIADLDVDGSGLPADSLTLTALGITNAELVNLANLYSPGISLWRVPIPHFTPWDCNWPVGPPADATSPTQSIVTDKKIDDPCKESGSIIECENQILGESIDITGVPFSLNYRSNRVPGRKTAYNVNITLSGDSIPASLKNINVEISVAGRTFSETFPPLTNQSYLFTWDGMNAYGKTLQGGQLAMVKIGYVYDAVYYTPSLSGSAFGQSSGIPLSGSSARRDITLWQFHEATIGELSELSAGLGGWSLSGHHKYDPIKKVLYRGDGIRRNAQDDISELTTVAGNGSWGYSGDGGPATEAGLKLPRDVAAGPDGSFYIADSSNFRIRKVDSSGIITTVAGNGSPVFSGDGGPATEAGLHSITGIAIDPDGSLYIVDQQHFRIRKVDSSGIITTVAGNGSSVFSGDGGPATEAGLNWPSGVAVAPDGSLYISDTGHSRIRKVDSSGIITTVAGHDFTGYSGDGGPATEAGLYSPTGIAVAPDGSLYIADSNTHRIRRVDSSGIITTVAGDGIWWDIGDGGLAIEAGLDAPYGVAVAPDGSLYIADYSHHRIRKVDPSGIITTVAGNDAGYGGDGGIAINAGLSNPANVTVSPDGNILIADKGNSRIRQITPAFPNFDYNDIEISSEDGSVIYQFNANGKHLRTINSLTGTILYQFSYDSNGYLAEIEDADGDVTMIQHDASGNPTSIITQDGQQTNFIVNSNGYIERITNPAGEAMDYVYSSDGLLLSVTDSRGNTSTMTYDIKGRLIKDENPLGGFWQLNRTDYTDGFTIDKTSALNRLTTYEVTELSTGDQQRLVTGPGGFTTETLKEINGTTTITDPDGTITITEEGPDPRFRMQAPIVESLSITTPGGLSFIQSTNRSVTLADEHDILSLQTQTDNIDTNGRNSSRVYDAVSRMFTMTTPEGRQNTTAIDAAGRIVQENVAGLESTDYSYDQRGRLTDITQGSGVNERSLHFNYNVNGNVSDITDGVNRTTLLEYDLANRVTRNTLPDLREINYGYDANGNVTSVTPPGRPVHFFDYTAVNLTDTYDPPDIGITPDTTTYSYSLDKELTQVLRPDTNTVGFTYNTKGQMTAMTIPGGAYTYAYDLATGKLITLTDPDGGTLSYSYDGSLLIDETWAGNVTGTVTRGYDNNFWVTSLSVNSDVISYGYDNDGLLTSAGSLTLARDTQNGLLTGTTLGNVTTSLGHNGFAEVDSESASYSGTSLYNSSFVYDNLGRIIEKTETVDSVTNTYAYGYDLAGRLETVEKDSVVVSTYTYGDNGNRLSLTNSGGTVSGTYDDQDRLTAYGGTTYTYTANGEHETKTVATDITTYNYDELGNLISVTLPDGTVIDYIVDGRNRRVAKKVNGVFIEGFLYQDQLNPVAKVDDTGSMLERYVYADKGNVPAYMIKGANTYRIISDHLGSARIVININTGSIEQRIDYDEFGNVILDTNPGFQPFGFAGGLFDHQTGLVRFGVRDYDPETGRWTAKDPIRFAGGDTNLYRYVKNNPMNLVDPEGNAAVAVGVCVALIAYTTITTGMDLIDIINEAIDYKDKMNEMNESSCESSKDLEDNIEKHSELSKQKMKVAWDTLLGLSKGAALSIVSYYFCQAAPALPF